LFEQAKRIAPEDRAEWLAAQSGDTELRKEVTELLERFELPALVRTGGAAALLAGAAAHEAGTRPALPARIGRYEITREIGRGGMGVVYEAEQDHPRRKVAIKVAHRSLASERTRARLEQEGEFLGRLRHPRIAQIHEVGFVDGEKAQPFLA